MTTAYVGSAAQRLRTVGTYLMRPAELNGTLGIDAGAWQLFGRHWNELAPDVYAAELGTRRLRRYGHFRFTAADGGLEPLPHGAFVQPDNSNPLYIERDRHFEPLTEEFVDDPVLQSLLSLLGQLATALDDVERWSVKVTPFRVLASAGDAGQPTPEGLHRDGVTLVSSLLVSRDNAVGGESSVFSANGRHLLSAILETPGTLLLGDDRKTLHGVSPIRPRDAARPARRDVLVITFAP
ncbi:2OG-Fe dioxygenase family protein [Mycobacterium deserti]|uniref:2OG-Fe dioxygenase family protein n=1 Tax=Mycobacterium deserti TaxID=2978347 RepID=A0ABT2MHT5_9MYCO|nr:2OG-Fe dioxygenase family protein [Mycobacterium deserti]MCT7661836.1 2OG-Fe dioxygenase family protein [Mycobacterium deserti]